MITTNKTGITQFIQACIDNGLKHVVCSPGSRNAPLLISFDEHPDIETYVIHDERSAGFYALGLALELGTPVAVVCTSGSAVVNYYPAVVEAFYQAVPLVVISGDRPTEWVDHGDGQTIRQANVFDKHCRGFLSVSENCDTKNQVATLRDEVKEMFQACNGNWKGPIHFNCPLTEPLYGTTELEPQGQVVEHLQTNGLLSDDNKRLIAEKWNNFDRKLILVGQMMPDAQLKQELIQLCNDSSVAVLVENTSNLIDRKFIHCIDRALATIRLEEIEEFRPDLLITLGGAIISKRIKTFLRESLIKEHWKVGYEFPAMDTYRHLSQSFEIPASELVRNINQSIEGPARSNYGSKWKQKDIIAAGAVASAVESLPYSDTKVFELVLDYIPEESYLHMSNSSVVRYCQLFNPVNSIKYFANRGTSGIDGSSSTACGVALASPNILNVLITGDVSFFYDSNAFWSSNLSGNLRIILINNNGGSIFRIIDGPSKTSQLEKYFEAKHNFSAEHLCKAFDLTYKAASNMLDLERELQSFFLKDESNRPKLLEIHTPAEDNDQALKDFFKRMKLS